MRGQLIDMGTHTAVSTHVAPISQASQLSNCRHLDVSSTSHFSSSHARRSSQVHTNRGNELDLFLNSTDPTLSPPGACYYDRHPGTVLRTNPTRRGRCGVGCRTAPRSSKVPYTSSHHCPRRTARTRGCGGACTTGFQPCIHSLTCP